LQQSQQADKTDAIKYQKAQKPNTNQEKNTRIKSQMIDIRIFPPVPAPIFRKPGKNLQLFIKHS